MKLVLLLSLIGYTVCGQYNILPSSSEKCLWQSCVTLTQFAVAANKYLDSNITLILEPGIHSLDLLFSVSNVTSFSIISVGEYMSKLVTSDAIVSCGIHGRLDFSNILSLRIIHVHFIGCVSNSITFVKHFIVQDSSFLGQETISSRLLQLTESVGSIVRCSFYDNGGGAVRSTRSEILFVTCVFNCTNGALVFEDYCTINIVESTFYICSYDKQPMKLSVGTLYLTDHCKMTVQDSLVQGNKIHSPNSVIVARNSSSLIINGGNFRNIHNCGIISSVNSEILVVNESVFVNNEVNLTDCELENYSDSIYPPMDGIDFPSLVTIEETYYVYIYYCQFTTNIGGILRASNSRLNVSKSKFVNNTKAASGTVIWAGYSVVNVSGCEFRNNQAITSGGAMTIMQGRTIIERSFFDNNQAN